MRKGAKHTEEHKKYMSQRMRGKRNALGCKRSLEFKQRLSAYWKDNPKHNHWIDGRSRERQRERTKARGQLAYRVWREAVFSRDNWTCVRCCKRGGILEADHVRPWVDYPEYRYSVFNGRTLCYLCHRTRPAWDSSLLVLLAIPKLPEEQIVLF